MTVITLLAISVLSLVSAALSSSAHARLAIFYTKKAAMWSRIATSPVRDKAPHRAESQQKVKVG